MNFPNLLTLSRIALIPVFVVVFYLPFNGSAVACAAVFALAAITDWFDGYLARRWDQMTAFGAFLDPVADKLMVAVALTVLIEQHHNFWLTLPAMIIIGREIVISALREWMAEMGKRASVAVSLVGKIKTTAQMTSIILLLANPPGVGMVNLGLALLYLAAALTLWSMAIYLKAAWVESGELPVGR